ncbi:DUF6445 family protein [Alteromonas macleodii]|uniref:DUF6445 family protein n=1 Tax=Alteromonas macleodii TaxID=28108 RepID=UPI0039F20B2F
MKSDCDAEEISRFNRAVLYPANLLHSGCLPNDISDSVDVKEGRLTANASIIFKE